MHGRGWQPATLRPWTEAFSRWLQRLYSGGTLSLDYRSCEMVSDELAEHIGKRYPGRKVEIEISEDGENGSISKYE